MIHKAVLVSSVFAAFFASAVCAAENLVDNGRCRNCEAIVVLDSAQAQPFIDILTIISSMPLRGIALEQEISADTTPVIVSTYPDYARENDLTSFDVAKKMTDFAKYNSFGIKSITATWTPN